MANNNQTRRQYLNTCGAVAAGLGLSGCLSTLPPLGQRVNYGRVDLPDGPANEPDYRRWIPALSELPYEMSAEDLGVSFVMPNQYRESPFDADPGIAGSLIQIGVDYAGYGFDRFDRAFSLGFQETAVTVQTRDVESAFAKEALVDGGYDHGESYAEYELFEWTGADERTVAVSNSAILHSQTDGGETAIKRCIDAEQGSIDRHLETNDSFARFTDEVGLFESILYNDFLSDEPEQERASAMTFTYDDDAGYFVHYHQYADAVPDESEIREDLENEDNNDVFQALSVDISIDEPFVEIVMRMDESDLEERTSEAILPTVTWEVDRETPAIRHTAGEPVSADRLNPEPTDAFDPAINEQHATVEPGDTLEVDPETLQTETNVRLFYEQSGNGSSTVITSHEFDEYNDETE